MALTDLNRPKLRKYSPKGVSQKGGYVTNEQVISQDSRYATKAKGQSRKISPSISNFGRSSNDPWLLAYREPGDLPVIELSGDITSALSNLTNIKTGLGVGRTQFLEDLVKAGSTAQEAKTLYQKELKNLKSAQTLVDQHRKSEFKKTAYADATRMVDFLTQRISDIRSGYGSLEDRDYQTTEDIPGLEKSLDSWMRKQQQAENRMLGKDLGGMFFGSQLQDIGERLGKTFDTKGELGEFRKKLAEKFRKTFFDPNITIINVPKRHKPGVVNYIPKPGGVDETHATGFTKFFIDKTKSQFIGISGENYNYPVVVGPHQGTFRLGIEGGRTVTGLGNADSSLKEGVDYFSGNQTVGADGIHTLPLGFWKNIGKEESDLPHNSRSQLSYMVTAGDLAGKYVFGFGPPTSGMAPDSPHMWQLSSKSIIPDVPNTWDVRGQTMWDQMGEYPWAASNQPSLQSKGVNFMAGTKKGKGFLILGDLHPYGFTTNMGYIGTAIAAASKLAIPIDDSSQKLKVSVPMGVTSTGAQEDANYDFPYPGQGSWYIGGLSLEDQLQSGVNFMYGAAKGKDVLDMPNFKTLHPKGFTPNMGKIKWDTQDADQYTGIASKLAIFPIESGGSESDRGKLKISANLDGLDGYEFPMPGQGSWHIAKHWRRRHLPPKDAKGWVTSGYYDLNVPDSQADYPIWSNMTIDPTKETAEKATNSLSGIDQDSENITKLNTLIGASTYKVPRIGSEIARKFLHPTAVENSENKFSYVDHYWRWKDVYKIRDEAAPGKMTKDQIHPIIYKTLIDMEGGNKETFRYSGDTDRTQGSRQTIEFIRGGVITSINRIKADQHRLKTLLHNSGNTGNLILGKQFLLQALNPRKETRVFNPLSIQAGATRVVKLQRHITAEGVWNAFETSFLNPIQNWLDPGSVSPVTPGVYERYEGYDWGDKNRRGKKNKLAKWAYASFPEIKDDAKENSNIWGKLKKAVARSATKSFTSALSSLTGINLDKDPDPPSRYVDSQKTLDKKPLTDHINPKFAKYSETINPDDVGMKKSQYVNLIKSKGYGNAVGEGRVGDTNFEKDPQKRVDHVGHQGQADLYKDKDSINHPKFGRIHLRTSLQVDKINAHRYGDALPEAGGIPGTKAVNDFIKFRFKDMVTKNNIIFRAILSGINDNITPEWTSERYIGRADQVHVYKGADRNISFNFAIAPKSKIELPILMEKLNYLIGLCYPAYDKNNGNRMVPPMTQLTIGNILDEAPGFLNSLSYTVEESSPWEIQEGLQFPKFINVSCDYRYIGNQLPSKYGIHFGYDESNRDSAFYKSDLDAIDKDPDPNSNFNLDAAAGKSGRLG